MCGAVSDWEKGVDIRRHAVHDAGVRLREHRARVRSQRADHRSAFGRAPNHLALLRGLGSSSGQVRDRDEDW